MLAYNAQEYTKRPRQSAEQRKYHPRHVVHPSTLSLEECLALSDVVVSAVPSAAYKVKTSALKDGCVCLNVAADKNFETDVREKVRRLAFVSAMSVRGARADGVRRRGRHPCICLRSAR